MIVIQVAELIEEAKIEGINNVYTNNIPASAPDDKSVTDLRITELPEIDDDAGSDQTTTITKGVSIDIFYSTDADSDDLESRILNLMMNNGWFRIYSPGHTLDPETMQLSKTMHFTQKFDRNLKGIA
ncbi:DUF806 family protein [Furfurilactobacillus siliginis]|uniref:Phage tail protein n=1 Tax=Furfurilactobacillus siliginis TaxID=348151 RepID=A0A0R2L1I5_9LACO|nr:DUF806 family protein [Furfurilactobacillus siliginis]KRN95522.1 hypothetical protein IV55_GL001985 [Furfurilactobacillus siliginis]GEK28681.1 hypothetical protein LSI01_09920 [Furfurilactobacillus siliginis]